MKGPRETHHLTVSMANGSDMCAGRSRLERILWQKGCNFFFSPFISFAASLDGFRIKNAREFLSIRFPCLCLHRVYIVRNSHGFLMSESHPACSQKHSERSWSILSLMVLMAFLVRIGPEGVMCAKMDFFSSYLSMDSSKG